MKDYQIGVDLATGRDFTTKALICLNRITGKFQILVIEVGNAAESLRRFRAVWPKRRWAKVVRRKK